MAGVLQKWEEFESRAEWDGARLWSDFSDERDKQVRWR